MTYNFVILIIFFLIIILKNKKEKTESFIDIATEKQNVLEIKNLQSNSNYILKGVIILILIIFSSVIGALMYKKFGPKCPIELDETTSP